MKVKIRVLLTLSLGLATIGTAGLLASQWSEHQTLAMELASLPPEAGRTRAGLPASPARRPGSAPNLLLKPFLAKSGDAARRELVRQLRPEPVSAAGRDPLNHLTSLMESLSAEELLAVIGTEPAARFTLTADGLSRKPQEEIDEALARLAALRRLCVVSPEQALAVCAADAPPKASDQLINVTAFAMRQYARENPTAAIRWGKENVSWLPANWPGWVLTEVARTESLASAAALARREGFLLAESMRWCGTESLDSINQLMTVVEAERAAAPDRFAENKLVRQGYQKVAEKISNSLGFDETRKFAEKWTAELPWREDAALLAVESTAGPDSAPQTGAAADWMMDFVPEDRRAAAAENLMRTLSRLRTPALAQWLEKHQAAPWRDPALAAFSRRIATTDPAKAAQWASAITDETLRAATLAAFPKVP